LVSNFIIISNMDPGPRKSRPSGHGTLWTLDFVAMNTSFILYSGRESLATSDSLSQETA